MFESKSKLRITLEVIGFFFFLFCAVACGKENKGADLLEGGKNKGLQKSLVAADLRTVLIEEFTGQECPNCPNAARALKDFTNLYPAQVVTVALHARSTGMTRPPLQLEAADKYAQMHQVTRTLPGIVLNRKSEGGILYNTKIQSWKKLIEDALKTPALVKLTAGKAEVNGRGLSLALTAKPTEKSTLTYSDMVLTLWVVEDLEAFQQEGGKKNEHYHHHNVLRQVVQDAGKLPETGRVEVEVQLDDKVTTPATAKVVAFLTNIASGEVLEALLIPLGKGKNAPQTPTENEKKPQTPTIKETKVAFTVNGEAIDTSKDLINTDDHSGNVHNGRIELTSPYVSVKFPSQMQGKKVTVEIKKLTHQENTKCGITGFCLEDCTMLPQIQPSYSTSFEVKANQEYNLNVHYGIEVGGENVAPTSSMHASPLALRAGTAETYRVELTMKQGESELSKLTFAFTPKSLPLKKEGPTTPPSTPAPIPKKPESDNLSDQPQLPSPPAAEGILQPNQPAPPVESTPPALSVPVVPAPPANPALPIPPALSSPEPTPQPAPALPSEQTPPPPTSSEPAQPQTGDRPYPSNVVVLDFTGQWCPACPPKMERLAEIKKEMKENLVVVAMHPWYNFSRRFCTIETEFYGRDVRSLPTLLLNNIPKNKYNLWGYKFELEGAAQKSPLVTSTLTAQLIDRNKVEVAFHSVEANGKESIDNHPKVNVLFWILENDLVGFQRKRVQVRKEEEVGGKKIERIFDQTVGIEDYHHQHIFRAVLANGKEGKYVREYAWGDPYKLGEEVKKTFSLPDNIEKKENTEVVAILLDADTHQFLDAVTFRFRSSSH